MLFKQMLARNSYLNKCYFNKCLLFKQMLARFNESEIKNSVSNRVARYPVVQIAPKQKSCRYILKSTSRSLYADLN